MDITKYTGYFHDGSLLEIDARGNHIILSLESAEIDPMEIGNVKVLSKSNTLFGKLHLKNVKEVRVNQKPHASALYKTYDDGEILDLEVHPGEIFLLIQWTNFPPKPKTTDVSRIEVQAEEIYWENRLSDTSKREKNDEYLDAYNNPTRRGAITHVFTRKNDENIGNSTSS